jgi:hypothetical protein
VEAGTAAEWSGQAKMAAGEAELRAGKFIGPIAWAAVGGGEGRSVEVGGKKMGLGAGVGEEQSGVPHVGVGAAVGIRAGEVHDLELARG